MSKTTSGTEPLLASTRRIEINAMSPTVFPAERTAVVTGVGAQRGIGRAVARRLAGEGWSLALIDIDEIGVREFKKELAAEGFDSVVAIPTDITSAESVDAAFAIIENELPAVVGLVNLAGIPCPVPLLDLSVEEWNRVLAVNATGSFLMLKAAAKRMVGTGVGRIVNTSSITAFDGGGTYSKGAYAAAKAAVLGLSRGAARELGAFGITVNTVAPGPVDTDIMGGKLTDERKQAMAADIPVGRIGGPEDIAAVVSFLLSADAGFITGATFQVDGGKYMH
jgi:NAD(P)-dependent dehydrogenase (short-subunit alcohol dehydrogenase family)